MSTPMALNNVQFLVPIDGGVSKLQAVLPPAVWYVPNHKPVDYYTLSSLQPKDVSLLKQCGYVLLGSSSAHEIKHINIFK